MENKKGKYVSRAAFAKMQGEKQRLQKDLHTIVMNTNGKEYELLPDPFARPHLADLKKEAETVAFNSVIYWQLRCQYLEKVIDETYSNTERDNCRTLYLILVKREL
jgi:hypothetical protein